MDNEEKNKEENVTEQSEEKKDIVQEDLSQNKENIENETTTNVESTSQTTAVNVGDTSVSSSEDIKTSNTATSNINASEPKKNNTLKIVLIIVGVLVLLVILLVVAVLVAFGIIKGNSTDNSDATTPSVTEKSDNKQTDTKKESTKKNTKTEVSSDWKKYNFSINGEDLSLPIKYSEFKEISGFNVKSVYADTVIPSKHYMLFNLYEDDNLSAYVEITNNTKESLKYEDGMITRISQSEYQVKNGATVITFPGNLQVGMEMTKDDLVSLLGKPSKESEYDGGENYKSYTYTYNEYDDYSTFNYYKIEILNGVISDLEIDNRDYQ